VIYNSRVGADISPAASFSDAVVTQMSHHIKHVSDWLHLMDFSSIHVEYLGGEGRGEFFAPRCYRSTCSDPWTVVGERSAQLIQALAILLVSRYPNWQAAYGSCGDFRVDLNIQELIHTHYVRSERTDRLTMFGL
jgi:hypothetical protein